VRAAGVQRVTTWSFGHYLGIAPPEYALGSSRAGTRERAAIAA
jgi:hypothetical protein